MLESRLLGCRYSFPGKYQQLAGWKTGGRRGKEGWRAGWLVGGLVGANGPAGQRGSGPVASRAGGPAGQWLHGLAGRRAGGFRGRRAGGPVASRAGGPAGALSHLRGRQTSSCKSGLSAHAATPHLTKCQRADQVSNAGVAPASSGDSPKRRPYVLEAHLAAASQSTCCPRAICARSARCWGRLSPPRAAAGPACLVLVRFLFNATKDSSRLRQPGPASQLTRRPRPSQGVVWGNQSLRLRICLSQTLQSPDS